MKIFELIGVKKFYDKDLDEVIKSMKSNGGYEEDIGEGSFGIVLKNSSKPEVVKFWITDSSYDNFIDYIEKHPSKYFPKLYSKPKTLSSFFLRTSNFPDKIKYVRMEKLNSDVNYYEADFIETILKKILRVIATNGDIDKFSDDTMTTNGGLVKEIEKGFGDFREFCEEMFKFLNVLVHDGGHGLDIHEGNIMKRNNGEIVITDPIYNSDDLQKARAIESEMKLLKKSIQGDSGYESFKDSAVKGRTNSKERK